MISPPTHIQAISGSTTTATAIDPAGRLAMPWPPVDVPMPPTASKVR